MHLRDGRLRAREQDMARFEPFSDDWGTLVLYDAAVTHLLLVCRGHTPSDSKFALQDRK